VDEVSIIYEVHILDPFGGLLAMVTDFADPRQGGDGGAALSYGISTGQVGQLDLTLPVGFDDTKLLLDGRIEVWRKVGNLPAKRDGDAQFLIRRWDYGDEQTSITAYHVNDLLRRRIINYYAGTTYSSKTATAADNLMKAFASQQLGSGIVGADRIGSETMADISTYLAIQANLGAGASMNKAAAWRNLFDLLRDLCDASTEGGTYLTFDVVATSPASLELQTFTGQRGVDRRASSGQPLIFSVTRGNIENVNLRVDRTDEVTFVTGGAQGEGTFRTTATDSDNVRMAESPLNRREVFIENVNLDSATTLGYECSQRLREGRPKITLSADVVETATCTRGVHYDFGDYVTIEHRGQQYNTRIDAVGVSLNNREQISRIQFRVNA
jgi:hypothetical protein